MDIATAKQTEQCPEQSGSEIIYSVLFTFQCIPNKSNAAATNPTLFSRIQQYWRTSMNEADVTSVITNLAKSIKAEVDVANVLTDLAISRINWFGNCLFCIVQRSFPVSKGSYQWSCQRYMSLLLC